MRLRGRPSTGFWVGLALVAMVWVIYYRVGGFQFLNFDDREYVPQNPVVLGGLSWQGVRWAFTTFWESNWHPVTWLSHMADVSLFGPGARAPHLVNVAFHSANAVLLFLLLRSMTGSTWRSALVAALFAVHPQRVESVAWVAERKDLLSTCFTLLTLRAYVAHARSGRGRDLAVAAGCYALALMSKPMPVSLPILLLLLDRWPLNRLPAPSWAALWAQVKEKGVFVAMAGASCVLTLMAQQQAMATLTALPFPMRLGNTLWAYLRYLGYACWPRHLIPFYPFPTPGAIVHMLVPSALMLGACTWFAVAQRARRPYLLVGWFWFLASLLPVIGLVQVGGQAMADRYTYLPLLGPLVILVWGGAELAAAWKVPPRLAALACAPVLAALMVAAWVQVGWWYSTETLFRRSLAIDPGNPVALMTLGLEVAAQGHVRESVRFYQEAVKLNPAFFPAQDALGETLYALGNHPASLAAFAKALQYKPDDTTALNRAAELLARQGKLEESVGCYRRFLALEPQRFKRTLDLRGELALSIQARVAMTFVLKKLGWTREAVQVLAEGLRQDPSNPSMLLNLGLLLEAQGRSAEAVEPLARCALRTPNVASVQLHLGRNLARTGRFREARAALERAQALAPADPEAARELKALGTEGL